MCSISGIYSFQGEPVQREQLLQIRDHMSSRGPDGCGIYFSPDERLGLAHRRLSILDLSEAGAQPMASPDGNLVVTFNGEIYNYPELRRDLEARGTQFRSDCDTEILLHLYALKGEAMLNDLRGMFAFGLWDARKRALLLACDPFGMKPLYYADNGASLRFASQVKALLAGGDIDTAPEPAGHVGFHLWGSVPQPYTLYRGIKSLPAGHLLWVDEAGAHKPRVYCNVAAEMRRVDALARDVARAQTPAQTKAAREAALGQLGTALRDSLKHHLLSDVPVSLFLSAGRDSATLAALVSEVTTEPISTVTLAFDEYRGTERDETPLAEELARHYGTRQHTIRVRGADFRGQVGALFDAMDQPTIDGVNSYLVSRAAASTGAKVALSGLGGDEMFGGYPSFAQIPKLVNAVRPLQMLPLGRALGQGFRLVSARLLGERTSPKYASLLEYGGTYGGAYLLRRGLFMPWELPQFLDGELVRAGWRELQTLARLNTTARGLSTPHLKISALETAWYMKNQLLRDTDWASMAHSLEVRTPLVDIEVLRSVVALSAAGTLTKADLASTPRKPLPDAVFHRKKSGFSVPVALWLAQQSDEAPAHAANDEAPARPGPRMGRVGAHGLPTLYLMSERKLRILNVITSTNPAAGGPIENVTRMSQFFGDTHVFEVACLDAPDAPWIAESPLTIHALGPSRGGVYAYAPGVVRWLRANRRNYDAVLVRGIWQFGSYATWKALRNTSTPYFVFPHGMLDPWFKRTYPLKHVKKLMYWPWAEFRVLRDARAVCFTCEEERVLARQSFGLYRVREAVVNYGTAAPTANADAQRAAFLEQFPELADKKLLLFLSRIHVKKGADLLIEAFAQSVAAQAATAGPQLHLVMAGPDQQGLQSELVSLAEKLGVADRITWTGMLQGELKWGAFRAADAFVLPSHQENFGIVVAEALACGVPVLISDKVNIWREIAADQVGWVAPDTLEGTLANLTAWLQASDDQIATMRAAAVRCFNQRFEIGGAARSLLAVIERELKR